MDVSIRKIKIYLDTNTIVDFFINEAKSFKRNEKIKLPEKYQFFASKVDEIEFVISILTKNEIIRELISGFNLSNEEVLRWWNEFIVSLDCRYINEIKINENLTDVTLNFRMKSRTLINVIHLFVAVEQNAYFLTGDKDLVELVKENRMYGKILTYPDFRKMFT